MTKAPIECRTSRAAATALTFARLVGHHAVLLSGFQAMTDHYPLCSTLEWKLGIHLSEWRDARELSYRRTGKLHQELETAHCAGVVKLLREYLEHLERNSQFGET